MMEKTNFELFVDWMQKNHNWEYRFLVKRIEEWYHGSEGKAIE